jgi:monoamine oxidase
VNDDAADVVVVGAGVSGLVATSLLVRGGLRVVCLEARDRMGGRAFSPQYVDLGATWWWPGETSVQALAQQLELRSFDHHLVGNAVVEQLDGSAVVVDGNPIDVPSYRFEQGAQELAHRLAAALPAGTVRLDSAVEAIALDGDGAIVTAGPSRFRAPQVVLALPPSLAVATIAIDPPLDPTVRDIASQTAVWMGNVVKAVALYPRPLWRPAGLAGAAVSYSGPFREFHDLSGPDGAGGIFGFAPAGAFIGHTNDQIRGAFCGQLARLFGPDAGRPDDVQLKDWSRDPWTTPPGNAGQTATFGHPVFQHDGPLLWASTETATAYAGHLEGAVRAGTRAARSILRARH